MYGKISDAEMKTLAESVAANSASMDEVFIKLSFYQDAIRMQDAASLINLAPGRAKNKRSVWGKGFLQLMEDRVGQAAIELKSLSNDN
jgi:hypothetical protein